MRVKLGLICCVLIASITLPSSLHAQEISQATKKDVVKNFQVNLSSYAPFGNNCEKKPQGDANCDGTINQFDLSIWEVEFNTPQSPRRSDFNNDGQINLLDFGIWRNTIYPQQTSSLNKFIASISSIFNLKSLITNIYAQESASGGAEINSSTAFISESNNSQVVNSLSGDNTQQITFDSSGNPQTAALFTSEGQSYAEVAFLSSGGTIVSTEQSGVPITIAQTPSGPVIENFKNPDGSLLAIKSWPTQSSYDKKEPPLSVTIPGQENSREVLTIQPNGDAIIEKNSAYGVTLNRSQLRSNGTLLTEDFKNQTTTQSNSRFGFTTLSMKNNLGGESQYMFYKGSLYAVIQADNNNTSYISKPLSPSGNSWTFETLVGGQKQSEKNVTNPITELNSGTPDPNELIKFINFYKKTAPNPNAVDFSDGFPSTNRSIQPQISKANSLLKISETTPPAVLGIIKEAHAQQSGTTIVQTGSTPINPGSTNFAATSYSFSVVDVKTNQSIGDYSITVPDKPIQGSNGAPTDYGNVRGTGLPEEGRSLSKEERDQALESISRGGSPVSAVPDLTAYGIKDPSPAEVAAPPAPPTVPTGPAGPGAPAAPAAPAAKPDTLTSEQKDALSTAAKAAGEAADKAGTADATRGNAARDAARASLSGPVKDGMFSEEFAENIADKSFIDSFLSAHGIGLNQGTPTQVQSAIDALNTSRYGQGQPPTTLTVAEVAALGTAAPAAPAAPGTSAPAPPSAPSAGAAAAGGIPAPTSGLMADGRHTSTVTSLGEGNFESKITDAAGHAVATQVHNPGNLTSQWDTLDAAGNVTASTFAYGGTLTSYSAGGLTVGYDVEGNVSAGGWIDGNGFMHDGRTGDAVTDAERSTLETAKGEQGTATGAEQYGAGQSHFGMGTCFLPGTLISTPNGQAKIETLKPGDKVYSYDEKTGQKQISDFKQLDINFVDEYLIINKKIHATVYHPFYIVTPPGLKTVRADQLKLGEILQNETGKYVPVYSIEKVSAPKTTVYNLMNVSPNNNFYAEGILVHNYADGSEYDVGELTGNWGSQEAPGTQATEVSTTTTEETGQQQGTGTETDQNSNTSNVDTSSTNDNSGNGSNDSDND